MQYIRVYLIIIFLFSLQLACRKAERAQAIEPHTMPRETAANSALIPKFPAKSFAYPVGKFNYVTETKDHDDWYNAQNFGENRHLGEDWNKNSGGNTDCGEPVYAVADGRIIYAQDAGAGWGNVLIIEHTSPAGIKIESLYGHLQTINKFSGAVKKKELLGTIGNANGRYFCHLHFELRTADCPLWNQPGSGYGDDNKSWLDPSEFINRNSGER